MCIYAFVMRFVTRSYIQKKDYMLSYSNPSLFYSLYLVLNEERGLLTEVLNNLSSIEEK
jgi:hypothetical protein